MSQEQKPDKADELSSEFRDFLEDKQNDARVRAMIDGMMEDNPGLDPEKAKEVARRIINREEEGDDRVNP